MMNDELDVRSKAEEAAAAKLCLALASYLKMSGYHFVCISIAKLVKAEEGEGVSVPGATIVEASDRCLPAFQRQAGVLDDCAERLRERLRKSGVTPAPFSQVADYVPPNNQGN